MREDRPETLFDLGNPLDKATVIAIRKALNVKKVSASRKKKEAVILSEDSLDPVLLEETIRQTGYTPGEIHTEEYERKSLLSHITGEI